jgi:hypothetical protein
MTDDGRTTRVNRRWFSAHLAAGAGAKLLIGMQRFGNQPTLDFPEIIVPRSGAVDA